MVVAGVAVPENTLDPEKILGEEKLIPCLDIVVFTCDGEAGRCEIILNNQARAILGCKEFQKGTFNKQLLQIRHI